MTQQQATELQRAMEIAKEHNHKVFTATHNLTKATVYTVRSHSDINLFHILYIQAGRIICDCQRHQHGHICSHAAAVRLFLIAQRDALAAIEQQEAQQLAESSPVENTSAHCPSCHTTTDKLIDGLCVACYQQPVTRTMYASFACSICQAADAERLRAVRAEQQAVREMREQVQVKREAERTEEACQYFRAEQHRLANLAEQERMAQEYRARPEIQEAKRAQAAARRESAILATDERPFSTWK